MKEVELILPTESTSWCATLVEGCHRLISTSGLDLHEVGAIMVAFGASRVSGVHVFPSSSSAKNVVNLEMHSGLFCRLKAIVA